MSFISDMTAVLLDEISIAEKMFIYGREYESEWFMNNALDMADKAEKHFADYLEITGIKEKALKDTAAKSIYDNLKSRIDSIKLRGDKWG